MKTPKDYAEDALCNWRIDDKTKLSQDAVRIVAAEAAEKARAAGYRAGVEASALKCDELARNAATQAAREEADCDASEADIHHHAANVARTAAHAIRALIPDGGTISPVVGKAMAGGDRCAHGSDMCGICDNGDEP